MKPSPLFLGVLAAASAAPLAQPPAAAADRIIVGARPGFVVAQAVAGTPARPVARIDELRAIVLELPAGSVAVTLRRLRRSAGVRYAERDRRKRASELDPGRAVQWGLDAIGASLAWPVSRGDGIVVAVIDTGVAAAPDLAGRILPGWNVLAGTSDATDDNGHGTHVAGTIAELEGNGIAEAGVAPGAQILPVKVLDAEGAGSDADIAAGLVWAADHGARVVNLSLGGPDPTVTLASAVAYARAHGVIVVAAAGNEAGPVDYPARLGGVVAVAAVDRSLQPAWFSNHGRQVDLSAPGLEIVQQTIDGAGGFADESLSGTSMAAPHVAGAIALVLAADPSRTPAGVVRLLKRTAQDLGEPGFDQRTGAGLVRIDRALAGSAPPPAATLLRWPEGLQRSRSAPARSGSSVSTGRSRSRRSRRPGSSASRARTPTGTAIVRPRRRASPRPSTRPARSASCGSSRTAAGPSPSRPSSCGRGGRTSA